MSFERVRSERVFAGDFVEVFVEDFEHDDGESARREVVRHPGAVVVIVLDGDELVLVRQPREAVGEASVLELVAGKLDPDEDDPLEAAKRELAEEVGLGARRWTPLKSFWTSPGFTDERMHLYLAEDVYGREAEADEEERIEIERVPLADIDAAIERTSDAKTLIGLLWLRAFRDR